MIAELQCNMTALGLESARLLLMDKLLCERVIDVYVRCFNDPFPSARYLRRLAPVFVGTGHVGV